MSEITSRPYRPLMACERCAFGRGPHAEFCEWRVRFVRGGPNWSDVFDPEQRLESPKPAVRMCREHFTEIPCWRCIVNRVRMDESEGLLDRLFGRDVKGPE